MLIIPQEYHTETIAFYKNIFSLLGNYKRKLQLELTLNHKYSVDKSIPSLIEKDVLNSYGLTYYGIGINGYYSNKGIKNPFRPNNTELDLYRPIPFRCVKSLTDLTEYERDNYRLPVPLVINKEEYIGLYLKKIKQFKSELNFHTVNEEGQESLFDITSEDLFPSPNNNNHLTNSLGNLNYHSLSLEINHLAIMTKEYEDIRKFFFSENETIEISEFGLYTGYDDDINNKAYNVQLAYKFCNTGVIVDNNNYSRNVKITIGNKLLT